MGISIKTHKILWGKAGNRCSMPDCRKELVSNETEADDESIIGEEAHIVARNVDGPRGKSSLTEDERDKYDNLILLCRIHHKIVDDQYKSYDVKKLKEIKKNHEEWVKNSLTTDNEKLSDELSYAKYIDDFIKLAEFDNWDKWTSPMLSNGQPSITTIRFNAIKKIPPYLISRFWPNRYEELERAFHNFNSVLKDLIYVFSKYIERDQTSSSDDEDGYLWTEKFYRINKWDTELYNKLAEEYDFHVDLVEDLVLELTRAGNLICEVIRKYIYSKFREEEGKLLIYSGPDFNFSWRTLMTEYKLEEKKSLYPYPGLKKFMTERVNRDFSFGSGYSKKYE